LSGRLVHGVDRVVESERLLVARIAATDLLRTFARQCDLDVIDLWDAPAVVRQYLETGDESLRKAAGDAAWDAWDAAWDAWDAWDAARAARAAARSSAARAAAWDAWDARAAARAAAWDARAAQRTRFNEMVAAEFAKCGS
jgi:hypothetical protein